MPSNPLVSAYRKFRFGEPVVVVSGLPRSGTSMAMKMLAAGGLAVVTDGERTADEDNPKGYYEDERVKDLGQMEDKRWLKRARGKAIKIISFLLKELPHSNNYRVIFMRRDLTEVMASQNKMLERRGEPVDETDTDKMIARYTMHLRKTEFLLEEEIHFDSIDIEYRQVVDDPRTQAILNMAKVVVENRGQLSDDDVQSARDAGLSDAELIEVVSGAEAL